MHTKTFASVLGLIASANAHIVMSSPKGWDVNNSPLAKDGSDFPCKGVSYDSSVPASKMSKGEQQQMTFKGSAVHGGGSCQVSLTTDTAPTKDSVWKVIKTFEGGCPAKGVDGNYGENANMELPDKYGFEIPEGVPAGKYTLAWTWFNKVGNREMYMNCAPIEAEGSGGSESDFQALPDMFTANIYGEKICETEESYDVQFPNPGEYVEKLGTGQSKLFDPSGCPDASSPQYGSGSGGSGSGGSASESGAAESSAPAESAAESSGAEASAPVESAPAGPGDIFAPIGGLPDAVPTEAPAVPAAPSAAESSAESAAPTESAPTYDEGFGLPTQAAPANGKAEGGSTTPSVSGGHGAGEACTTDGFWNCIDGTSFQRCASGIWSATQQLSEGTECTPGEAENLQMTRKRGTTRFGAKFLL